MKKVKNKKEKYEYVMMFYDNKRKRVNNIVGLKNIQVLLGFCANYFTDKKNKNIKMNAWTKKEADKLGIKPNITCLEE